MPCLVKVCLLSTLYLLLNCVMTADLRRLRSVDNVNPLLNSVEYIWATTTVAVGDTAVLHCSFDAIFQQLRTGNSYDISFRQIDWFKEQTLASKSDSSNVDPNALKIATGKKISIDDKRFRVYRPHNSALSVLILRRSRKQDAGIYRCNLSGSNTRYKYMILNVTESKIEAQTSPAKTVGKVGTDVALWCNASGYPKPVVYWAREDRNRTLPDGTQQFWGNELYFEKVTEGDTGVYTCYLDNFVQPVVSYKFSLFVEDNPWHVDGSKMRFDSSQWYPQDSPDPKPARGKSYLLLCETRGSPKPLPKIVWYRDGKPLRNNRHFYIIEDAPEWRPNYSSSTLVIMRFMADFQGNYTCVASNDYRMKKQTFSLTEASPDEKPIAPNVSNAKITNKDGRWSKDGGSGGSSKLPIKTALTNFLSPGAGAIDKSRSSNGKSKSGSAVKTHLRKLQEQQRARMGASTPRSTTGQPLSTAVIGKPLTKDTAVQKTATSEIIKPNVYPARKSRPEIDDEDETEGGSANGRNVGETK